MAEALTEEEFEAISEAFALFDKNGDRAISSSEIGNVFKSLGLNPSQGQIEQMIKEFDRDGNGEIDFGEFVTMMTDKMRRPDTEEEIRQAFLMFDSDRSGYISVAEFMYVLGKLGEKLSVDEAEEIISEADADGDGQISFEEFKNMFK